MTERLCLGCNEPLEGRPNKKYHTKKDDGKYCRQAAYRRRVDPRVGTPEAKQSQLAGLDASGKSPLRKMIIRDLAWRGLLPPELRQGWVKTSLEQDSTEFNASRRRHAASPWHPKMHAGKPRHVPDRAEVLRAVAVALRLRKATPSEPWQDRTLARQGQPLSAEELAREAKETVLGELVATRRVARTRLWLRQPLLALAQGEYPFRWSRVFRNVTGARKHGLQTKLRGTRPSLLALLFADDVSPDDVSTEATLTPKIRRVFDQRKQKPREWLRVQVELERARRSLFAELEEERKRMLDHEIQKEMVKLQEVTDALDHSFGETQQQWLEWRARNVTLARLVLARYPDNAVLREPAEKMLALGSAA